MERKIFVGLILFLFTLFFMPYSHGVSPMADADFTIAASEGEEDAQPEEMIPEDNPLQEEGSEDTELEEENPSE